MAITSQFSNMTSLPYFIMVVLFFLSSLVTGPNFMSISILVITILYYKGLIINQETGNTPVGVLPKIWRQEQVRNTKFGTNVSNEFLRLNQQGTGLG